MTGGYVLNLGLQKDVFRLKKLPDLRQVFQIRKIVPTGINFFRSIGFKIYFFQYYLQLHFNERKIMEKGFSQILNVKMFCFFNHG